MPGGLPLVREQFGDAGVGVGSYAAEQIAEVSKGIEPEALAGGDQTGQDGGGLSAVVAAIKHPILTAHRDSTQAALGVDTLSPDPPEALRTRPIHPVVLEKQVLIIENLCNLDQLPDFFLFLALPLKIREGSGSPIRAVALVEQLAAWPF